MSPRVVTGAAILLGTVLLGGCAATVHLEPADDANNPLCAEVSVGLPDVIGPNNDRAQERRWTDAQATGAWGTPGETSASVFLRCGVAVPAPTGTLQCVTLEGVDWLVDDSESPMYRLTTYGRDPAVQLYVNTEQVSSNDVIGDKSLVGAIKAIPAGGSCTPLPEEVDAGLADDQPN